MIAPIVKIKDALVYKNCVLTFGHFNSVHPGHVRYLRHAASKGKSLLVAILSDTKDGKSNSYQFNQKERADGLRDFNFIDGIVLLEDIHFPLINAINELNPDLLILGKEFEKSKEEEIIKAIQLMKKNGKSTEFHGGEVHYATTQLLENSRNDLFLDQKAKFKSACKRHNLKLENMICSIESWEKTKLLVIGDTILDQYAACEAMGMSAEAPVLVVKELQKRNFIGGAAIVASHINALGANCEFISVVGEDKSAEIINEELTKQGISPFLIKDSSRPTTFKKRYVVENQKLFRVSRLNDHVLSKTIENKVIKRIENIAPSVKGIVISDFVYGVITEKIIKKVISLSKKYNLKIFGDLQCSSQIGLATKFKDFTLLCPNEKEARIALQDKESGLENLSNRFLAETNSEKLIMKLGAQGFVAYDKQKTGKYMSQSFPSLSINPLDVSGAGDSLLALMATGISSGNSFLSTAALGCCMSAIAVENMGNEPINHKALKNFLIKIFE